MDLGRGICRAARGDEASAFDWLDMQFEALRHGVVVQLSSIVDDALRLHRAGEIQALINGLGTVKGKAKRMGDGIHREADGD